MRTAVSMMAKVSELENPSLYCGIPQGDELPQAAGVEDILMDVYSDILNMPREYAAGCFHHQLDNDFGYEDGIIH